MTTFSAVEKYIIFDIIFDTAFNNDYAVGKICCELERIQPQFVYSPEWVRIKLKEYQAELFKSIKEKHNCGIFNASIEKYDNN